MLETLSSRDPLKAAVLLHSFDNGYPITIQVILDGMFDPEYRNTMGQIVLVITQIGPSEKTSTLDFEARLVSLSLRPEHCMMKQPVENVLVSGFLKESTGDVSIDLWVNTKIDENVFHKLSVDELKQHLDGVPDRIRHSVAKFIDTIEELVEAEDFDHKDAAEMTFVSCGERVFVQRSKNGWTLRHSKPIAAAV